MRLRTPCRCYFCRPLPNVEGGPRQWPFVKIRFETLEHFDRAQLCRRRWDASVDEALGALAEMLTRVDCPLLRTLANLTAPISG
jgi:hypothetical protein